MSRGPTGSTVHRGDQPAARLEVAVRVDEASAVGAVPERGHADDPNEWAQLVSAPVNEPATVVWNP
jgi:hypothetical protein